ncbi:hypothetical protein ACFV0T_26555 [Streptomyces sp. NPDC059582]
MTPTTTPAYPRPRLVHDHGSLFQEPVYADGPYDQGDEDGESDD